MSTTLLCLRHTVLDTDVDKAHPRVEVLLLPYNTHSLLNGA